MKIGFLSFGHWQDAPSSYTRTARDAHRQYIGEPDVVAEELGRDAAVRAADTLLVTVPNQLGVAYDTHLLRSIAERVVPAIS